MENTFFYKSPIGILKICYSNYKITSINLSKNYEIKQELNNFDIEIKKEFDEYFNSKRKIFNLEICPNGTDFQKLVWKELSKINYGETKSYSEIAKLINNPNAQRAVGMACNKNPILLIIPCHRIINKNNSIGGFAHDNNIKKFLLNLETKNLTN